MSFMHLRTETPQIRRSDSGGSRIRGMIKGHMPIVLITLAACLIFWVFVFSDSGWGPILTPLASQLHIPLATTGLFYVIWSMGYLPGALVGGTMLDRYGPRRILFIAALIVLCGLSSIYLGLLLPQLAPTGILIAIAGLAGIGGGIIDASTNGLISTVFAQRRGTALNLFNLLYPLGGILIALIDAGLLTIFHNDPGPPFVFTMCFIVVALFSLLGVPKTYTMEHKEALPSDNITVQPPPASLLATLVPVITVMMFTSGISSSVRAWTPAYLHVAFGQTPAVAAALSSITWALAVLSRLGAAALILRIGAWRLVMLGILISLAGFIAMMLSPNVIIATLAIALTGVGLSPVFDTCLAIGSERAGRSFGSVAGILLFVSGISTAFCGWAFGFLLNTFGPFWSVLFCFVFMICGGLMALRLRPSVGV